MRCVAGRRACAGPAPTRHARKNAAHQAPRPAPLQGLSDVCWNREGTLLATASDDRTLRLWDAEAGRCLHSFEGHTHYVYSCCFSEGGNLLVRGVPWILKECAHGAARLPAGEGRVLYF